MDRGSTVCRRQRAERGQEMLPNGNGALVAPYHLLPDGEGRGVPVTAVWCASTKNPKQPWFILETKPGLLVARGHSPEREVARLMPTIFVYVLVCWSCLGRLGRRYHLPGTRKPIAKHILPGV